MGCPGAGKGTQSALLLKKFPFKHISTGDVLRKEIASKSELGLQISQIINSGNLVPDELMIAMLEKIVESSEQGIIFDGFPRTVKQAEALDEMLNRFHKEISAVIMIDLPEEEVVDRIVSRRQCKACGAIVRVNSKNPATHCEACGGELFSRQDDTAEKAKHRLNVYYQDTLPVKQFYSNTGKYFVVNGNQTPEQVFGDIQKIIEAVK